MRIVQVRCLSDVAKALKLCITQALSLPTRASSKLVALDPIDTRLRSSSKKFSSEALLTLLQNWPASLRK
jgi:hypothetical protein